MARGKQTCKILKEIRRQIAEANDIEFATSECRYKGDCLGTCPKCEAEVRYLGQQLRSRQLMGKAVVLAGLSAGIVALSGCSNSARQSDSDSMVLQGEPMEVLEGAMILPDIEEELEEGEAPLFDDSVIVKEGEVEEQLIKIEEVIDPDNPEKKTSHLCL